MSLVVKISGDLLYNVKLNLPYDEEIKKLKILDFKDLILGLENDHQKKTFWINIYNAFYQILALEIDDKSIFKIKKIEIAECNFDTRIIKTSKLLFWYQKDFRSKAAIKALIGSVFLKDFSNYNLKYNNYSWIKKLQNFSQ